MSTPRAKNLSLAGWGNFPVEETVAYRPESERGLREVVASAGEPTLISRGLGRAYGDGALNSDGGVILHEKMNRFLSFDDGSGLLTCEAGVSFADIIETFLPRGFFPAVTPGTRFVTVGGAIAADVHGKNHHRDGSVGEFVQSFDLLTPGGEIVSCSRENNAALFHATLGGMGLTGPIVRASMKLARVETGYVNVDYRRAANIDRALELFAAEDQAFAYSVAWIDCLAKGESLGRSVLMRGTHATSAELPQHLAMSALNPKARRSKSVPRFFPAALLNRLSVKLFNALYFRRHGDDRRVVDYAQFFYPLDSILHWNRLYGRRGFVQYQALFPHETARAGLVELLEKLSQSRRGSFLAVLKTMGKSSGGLLSFPYPGQTLALDLPNTGADLLDFCNQLDEIVLKHGGRVYLAKDARLSAASVRAMYPRLDEFKQVKRDFDPRGRYASSLSRRLDLA